MTEKPVLAPDASHPIAVSPAGERVVVTVGEQIVADTTSALTMEEATYPLVHYVPLADVDPDVLVDSDHATYCPYKGDASYYSLVVDGTTYENAVWTYEAPYDAVADIAGHVAFYPSAADVRAYNADR